MVRGGLINVGSVRSWAHFWIRRVGNSIVENARSAAPRLASDARGDKRRKRRRHSSGRTPRGSRKQRPRRSRRQSVCTLARVGTRIVAAASESGGCRARATAGPWRQGSLNSPSVSKRGAPQRYQHAACYGAALVRRAPCKPVLHRLQSCTLGHTLSQSRRR